MNVSTHTRLERLTQPFRPQASARRQLLSLVDEPPHAERVADTVDESSLGDPMHKLILVEAGQLDVEGASGGWLIVPGHLIFVPAERAFHLRSAEGTHLLVAHLHPADAAWIHHGCWTTAATSLAREMLNQAARWSRTDARAGSTARLFFQTLSGLCAEWFSNTRMLWLPSVQSDAMRQAVLYVRDHLHDASLESVAAAAGLSPRSLQRQCQAELGTPWRDLLREARMMRGLELLAARRMPVSAVANEVGFATNAAFTTAFIKRFGMTPTDYVARRCAASWTSS